jgi:tetratricopeptide (TPR) repeat protein
VADRLMSNGRIEEARSLLEGLDARVEQRSGTVLLHLAAVGLLQGDEVLTLDSLERAEAFAPPSETAFGHLILGVQTRQWSRLPVYARSLTGSDASLTEAQATIVAILDERIDQAELAVRERGADNAREPLWHLLSAAIDVLRGRPIQLDESIGGDNRAETLTAIYGGSTNVRDVRPMLAHLLALESSAWRVWAVADMLRVQPPESGSLWSNFLAARGFVALDQGLEAERILRRITRGWPTFAPAWDLLEQVKLARVGRTHHIGMVRLREERRAALGPRPGEEAEELLTEAWKLELGGNLEPALEKARQAVAADPDLESALVKLGELQRKLGDWTGAIESLGRAARQTEPASDSEVVAEFVGLLLGARAATPPQITAERLLRELQSQMARLGSDPLVALELAELDGPGVSQAIGISRAYAHLDHFRESTENVAIESLRPGATQKWKDFYQSLEPERAALFLQGELRLDPGSIDLWVMYGEVLEAQGRRKEAIELYELIQSMVPSGKTLRAIASLLAHSGADPTLVQEKVDQACVLEHRDQPDVPMLVSVARALVNGNAPQINRGIGILSDIWTNRRSELTAADEIDVGQMFGTALVQRADPRDRKLAHEVLTDIAPRISDNPRRNLVTALGHLATQIPARQR